MSQRMAWALIALLAGSDPRVSPAAKARLRTRTDRLRDSDDPAGLLRSWASSRAERRKYNVAAPDLDEPRADDRLHLSGLSAPDGGVIARSVVEAYVDASDATGLVDDYFLVQSDDRRGNVISTSSTTRARMLPVWSTYPGHCWQSISPSTRALASARGRQSWCARSCARDGVALDHHAGDGRPTGSGLGLPRLPKMFPMGGPWSAARWFTCTAPNVESTPDIDTVLDVRGVPKILMQGTTSLKSAGVRGPGRDYRREAASVGRDTVQVRSETVTVTVGTTTGAIRRPGLLARWRIRPLSDIDDGGTERVASCAAQSPSHLSSKVIR